MRALPPPPLPLTTGGLRVGRGFLRRGQPSRAAPPQLLPPALPSARPAAAGRAVGLVEARAGPEVQDRAMVLHRTGPNDGLIAQPLHIPRSSQHPPPRMRMRSPHAYSMLGSNGLSCRLPLHSMASQFAASVDTKCFDEIKLLWERGAAHSTTTTTDGARPAGRHVRFPRGPGRLLLAGGPGALGSAPSLG